MESKKLKLLAAGRKGILLPKYPSDINDLYQLISTYMRESSDMFSISFKDQDGDDCEITNQETYEAAIHEFPCKIVLRLTKKEHIPVSVSVPEKVKLVYFRKKSRDMAFFDIENEKLEWHKLPKGINLKEYAAWVSLPSGEIFYCGGGHPISSDEAYLINPITRTYKKLPNMLYPRHSHAILYNNGYVYIFGGIENMLFYGTTTNKCEKYSLADSCWEEIEDIETARGDAAAAILDDTIYIMGKGSCFVFNYHTNQVVINLEEDNGGSMIINNNLLYAFQGNFIKVFDLKTLRAVEKIQLPGNKSWWSHSPPIWYKQSIYLLWWEEPGWVCKYDDRTKEFTRLVQLVQLGQ